MLCYKSDEILQRGDVSPCAYTRGVVIVGMEHIVDVLFYLVNKVDWIIWVKSHRVSIEDSAHGENRHPGCVAACVAVCRAKCNLLAAKPKSDNALFTEDRCTLSVTVQ